MADKKLRRCSGSSLNLREEMKQNYVIVHDVSSNVSFEKYIQFARGSFDQAVKLYHKKDYHRAFVDFTKFHQFIKEKLPSHQGYDHGRSENAKIWLLQADQACLEFLEEISFQLDIIEDERTHPNSRSVFLTEMQKHKVDIFVPEWIDQDSDDEGPMVQKNAPFNNHNPQSQAHYNSSNGHSNGHSNGNRIEHDHPSLSRSAFPNQHFTPPQMLHTHSLPPQHHQPYEMPARQNSELYSQHSHLQPVNQHSSPRHSNISHTNTSHAPQYNSNNSNHHEHTLLSPYKAHTESQDLAQAIQESLQSANSVKSDTTYSTHSNHSSHSSHTTNSTYSNSSTGHAYSRHTPDHLHNTPYTNTSTTSTSTTNTNTSAYPEHYPQHYSELNRSGSRSPAPQYNEHYGEHYIENHSGHYGDHYSSDPRTSYHQAGRIGSIAKFVLPGLTQDDVAILRHYKAYSTFDIPAPTIANHTIHIGVHPFAFQQHDFHLSFAPFVRTLPAELHMSRAAVEVNRCFFIHLGVATQLHPFALQSYFRHTAAVEKSIEEDWEQELARTISQYSGCVDANVLQYTWPANFDKYRILLISGPASDPLLTCFVPTIRNRAVEDLYEIVIRNDRDHYTLLRPLANLTTKIKVIDQLIREAKQQHLVCQVCEVTSKPYRSVGAVVEKL